MSKKRNVSKIEKDYINILNSYLIIVLIVVVGIGILGAIALPYYLSPITRSQGYLAINSNLIYFIPSLIAILLLLWGVSILEEKETNIGLGIILFSIIIILIIVWSINGISSVKVIFNIT
ncbi:MAG: hypothetical protein QXV69_05075 [Sulfolobaceae archaeon]